MNSLLVVSFAFFIFWFGYVVYAEKINRIFKPDPNKKTPAHFNYDGVDFVPARHWSMLFGHHFASIAGAAPIIGPILAVSIWGWAPTLLWVVLGTVFIGGIHDYCSLMVSVRHKGHSIADFAQTTISKNAKIIFLSFVWLALILVVSVFVNVCAKTLVVKPQIVYPSIGLIPVALLVGFLLYAKKNHQILVTIGGLGLLAGLIYLGARYPIVLPVSDPIKAWSVVLLLYAYIASVCPVNILLQPRDYLSTFLLLAGLVFGYIGIIAHKPVLSFPAFISVKPGQATMLWPVLFVTVACGAISGFHSLVASGTTSKQLSNEVYAKRTGYGAMVAEGLLAVLALLVVASAYSHVPELKIAMASGGGPVSVFGYGYGKVTESFLGKFGGLFAILVLNAFILTTLDTATRIGRYITQELFSVKNRYLATLVVIALSGWLGLSGEWNEIWPVFGAANQLIAALALIVITSWFLSTNKPIRYTLPPTVFMLITTVAALVLKIREYMISKNSVLLTISFILLGLAFFVLYEAVFVCMKNYKRGEV
ncbi:MAG: carbon starvation protein A [Candidatus Omnitrophota bacterium]